MSYISVTLTQYTKGCQRCGECIFQSVVTLHVSAGIHLQQSLFTYPSAHS